MEAVKTIVASCVLAFVFTAQAQPAPKVPRIGVVAAGAPLQTQASTPTARAFVQGLEEYGWRPGKNIEVLWRTAEGKFDRLPALIEELVRVPVDVLVVGSEGMAMMAMNKTRRIPIVMSYSMFPVEYGVAKSLAHPGGNVTGMVGFVDPHITGKRLHLLKAVDPRVNRVAVLIENGRAIFTPETLADAQELGITLFHAWVDSPDQIHVTIEKAVRQGANGLLVNDGPRFNQDLNRAIVQREAIRHRLPAVYSSLASVDDLIAYGTGPDSQRRSAYFVDRILKGTKPADLPIERVANPRLTINLRAARAIGLTIPPSVLLQAERVIQ